MRVAEGAAVDTGEYVFFDVNDVSASKMEWRNCHYTSCCVYFLSAYSGCYRYQYRNCLSFTVFSTPSLFVYLPLSSLTTNAEGPFRATRNIVALDNASTFVIKLPGGRDTNGVALLMS